MAKGEWGMERMDMARMDGKSMRKEEEQVRREKRGKHPNRGKSDKPMGCGKVGGGMTAACMAAIICVALLAGCTAGGTADAPVSVRHEAYERTPHTYTEVHVGDLKPELTLTLKMNDIKYIPYSVTNADLKLERVSVSEGDKVKKGDVLVTFDSGEIRGQIAEYGDKLAQNKLLMEHYSRLQKLDPKMDYRAELASLESENEVAALYMKEAKERLKGYQIVARRDGMITGMDKDLAKGTYTAGKSLVTEAYGSGEYTAVVSGHDRLPDELSEGTAYTASNGTVSCRVRLVRIREQKDGEGNVKWVLTFKALSDMSAVPETDVLTAVVRKEVLRGSVYVEKEAIHRVDGKNFVYQADENGYLDAVWVTVGDYVEDYATITNGLSGGEKVMVK